VLQQLNTAGILPSTTNLPFRSLIYTHNHIDHTGGVLGFIAAANKPPCAAEKKTGADGIYDAGPHRRRRTLISAVLALHESRLSGGRAASDTGEALAEQHAVHLREIELLMQFQSRGAGSDRKIDQVVASYDRFLAPNPELIGEFSTAPPAEENEVAAVDLQRFADEFNQLAIAQQDEAANILGIADFETIFDFHPDLKFAPINPHILRNERDHFGGAQ
jgi:metallo-beta-lactamase superfamily protein